MDQHPFVGSSLQLPPYATETALPQSPAGEGLDDPHGPYQIYNSIILGDVSLICGQNSERGNMKHRSVCMLGIWSSPLLPHGNTAGQIWIPSIGLELICNLQHFLALSLSDTFPGQQRPPSLFFISLPAISGTFVKLTSSFAHTKRTVFCQSAFLRNNLCFQNERCFSFLLSFLSLTIRPYYVFLWRGCVSEGGKGEKRRRWATFNSVQIKQ